MRRIILFSLMSMMMGPLFSQEDAPFDKFMVYSLLDKGVRQELELVDAQSAEIATRLQDLIAKRDDLQAKLGELKSSGVSEQELNLTREDMIQEFELEKQKVQVQVLKVLLPHQVQRLKELSAQIGNREAMKHSKTNTGLLTPEMLEYLDIDDKQAERIKARAGEIQKRMAETIRKLNEEAMEELMQELSAEQREKYQKLMGQRFIQ